MRSLTTSCEVPGNLCVQSVKTRPRSRRWVQCSEKPSVLQSRGLYSQNGQRAQRLTWRTYAALKPFACAWESAELASDELEKIPENTTKYPGWRVANLAESSTPTCWSPESSALCACASAAAWPPVLGSDTRTTVYALDFVVGQAIRVAGAGFVVLAGTVEPGVVAAGAVFTTVRVGVLTVRNCGVAFRTFGFLCAAFVTRMTPAATPAIRNPTTAGQNQLARVNGSTCATASPVSTGAATRRSPHSRQYSCPGAVSAPQSGHIPEGWGTRPPEDGIAGRSGIG